MARTPGSVNAEFRWAQERVRSYLLSRPWATAADVGRHLMSIADRAPDGQSIPPDDRLSRWLPNLRPKDDSEPWVIDAAAPEDARYVLPVLRYELGAHSPWLDRPVLTERVASWVVRLSRAVPAVGEDVSVLAGLARAYAAATSARERESLDMLLAHEPWADAAASYIEAIDRGAIHPDRVPLLPVGTGSLDGRIWQAWVAAVEKLIRVVEP